ncbi:MAG: phytanoyl-CoA dioxygenase family protein [Rhodospirillales bacterium]
MSQTLSEPRFRSPADPATVTEALLEQGYAIVEDWMAPDRLAAFNAELEAEMAATSGVNEDFGGKNTKRFGALFAKSRQACDLAIDPLLLGVADRVLLPHCAAYQINYTGMASLQPGERAQVLHRDSGLYPFRNPAPPVILATIWALSDFTAENGGTALVPGSHLWPDAREPKPEEVIQATMPAGSCLLYLGNVIHGGGANQATSERRGVLLQYSLGWLRQEENQYLSVPPAVAKTLSPRLQRLMGYAFGGVNLGMVDRKDPFDVLNELQPEGGSLLFPEDLLAADAKIRPLTLKDET